jgi:hypothetical protein
MADESGISLDFVHGWVPEKVFEGMKVRVKPSVSGGVVGGAVKGDDAVKVSVGRKHRRSKRAGKYRVDITWKPELRRAGGTPTGSPPS